MQTLARCLREAEHVPRMSNSGRANALSSITSKSLYASQMADHRLDNAAREPPIRDSRCSFSGITTAGSKTGEI